MLNHVVDVFTSKTAGSASVKAIFKKGDRASHAADVTDKKNSSILRSMKVLGRITYYTRLKTLYYRSQLHFNEMLLKDCLDANLKKKIQNKITYYCEKIRASA